MTTVYITKWWSTRGIIERTFDETCVIEGVSGHFFEGYYSEHQVGIFAKMGKDAFLLRTDAVSRVRIAATKKVKALTKQLLQMEAIASGTADV